MIVSEVPFQLVKIANGFSFLNTLLSDGLKNVLRKHSCFFTLEKIKYRSNLTASSDFAVTSRKMIVYTG